MLRKAVLRSLAGFTAACGLVFLLAGCGEDDSPESTASSDEFVAAYLFLDDDRFVADTFVDPMVMCNGWKKCTDAGFVYGLQAASVSRVVAGGWALELEFNRTVPADDRLAMQTELQRRAEELGLEDPLLLEGDDVWPSCAGGQECQTVDESIRP